MRDTDFRLDHVAAVLSHLEHSAEHVDRAVLTDVLQQTIDADERSRATHTGTEISTVLLLCSILADIHNLSARTVHVHVHFKTFINKLRTIR